MKVAILSFEYPPETGFGGIGSYSRYLAHGLKKLGVDVHVIAGTYKDKKETIIYEGIPVTRWGSSKLARLIFEKLRKCGFKWTSSRVEKAYNMYRCFKKLNARYKFDVLEMPECGGEGGGIIKFTNALTVVKFHTPIYLAEFYNGEKISIDIQIANYIEGITAKNADIAIAPSSFIAKKMVEFFRLKNEIRVIPNGINVEEIEEVFDSNILEKYHLPSDGKIILYSGRLEPRKGIDFLIKVLQNIIKNDEEVRFVFAGKDVYGYERKVADMLEKKKLPNKTSFLGHVFRKNLISLLKSSAVVVIPSDRFENFPYSCLEAMACGCAIVATRVGGIPEMIEDKKSGILVNPVDVKSFSDSVLSLLESKRDREILGKEAKERAKKEFDYIKIAKENLKLYKRYLGSK